MMNVKAGDWITYWVNVRADGKVGGWARRNRSGRVSEVAPRVNLIMEHGPPLWDPEGEGWIEIVRLDRIIEINGVAQ